MVYLPTYIYHKNQPNVSKYTSPMVWYGTDLLHFQKLLSGCIMVWPRPCSVNYRLVAVSLGSCEPCNPTSTYPMTSRHLPLQRGTRREHGKTHKKWNDLGMNTNLQMNPGNVHVFFGGCVLHCCLKSNEFLFDACLQPRSQISILLRKQLRLTCTYGGVPKIMVPPNHPF